MTVDRVHSPLFDARFLATFLAAQALTTQEGKSGKSRLMRCTDYLTKEKAYVLEVRPVHVPPAPQCPQPPPRRP